MVTRNNSRTWGLVGVVLVLFVYVMRSSAVLTFAGGAAYDLKMVSAFWWPQDQRHSEHAHTHADPVQHASSSGLTEEARIAHSHFSDRFTTIHEGWPPQPKAMGDVTWLTDSSRFVSQEIHQTAAGNTVAQESVEVRAALGARFTYLGTGGIHTKGQADQAQERVTYFSHTQRATVEVLVSDGWVAEVTSTPAADYQPPLIPAEVTQAVTIARDALQSVDHSRMSMLEGFGILALPSEGPQAFYAHRVVYVSFHAHEDAPPEYVAWVDLTEQTVVESGEE